MENQNTIHPTAIIHDGVNLGSNNYIGPYCVIHPNTEIGNNNKFTSHCSIGASPQHKTYEQNHDKKTIIGSNNVFREFCTIHSGTIDNTIIGCNNYLMAYSHIPHDALIGNNITIANNVQIGGHTIIDDYANIGLGAVIHQFSLIGKGCMIGMGTVIPKKKPILPFAIYVGNPAIYLNKNEYIINKLTITEEELMKQTAKYLEDSYLRFNNK